MIDSAPITLRVADPDDAAAIACLDAYFALLAQTFPADFDRSLPLQDAADFRPPQGAFFVAEAGKHPLGCVSLRHRVPGLAEVKRLWVAPTARGLGLARRLMAAVEDHARQAGYGRLCLDTNAALTAAISFYQVQGWAPIPAYTGFPATHWFGKAL